MDHHARVRWPLLCVASVLLLLVSTDLPAQMYRWMDDRGVVHYTQGIDSIPERYRRGASLPPEQHAAVVAALLALKDLEEVTHPGMEHWRYFQRLQRARDLVVAAHRVLDPGLLRTALGGAYGYYDAAEQLLQRMNSRAEAVRRILVRVEERCPRIAQLLSGPPAGDHSGDTRDREAAFAALRACASDSVNLVEQVLRETSGGLRGFNAPLDR